MIDMQAFEKGMGILAERFRSPMDPDAQKGYYAILSEELSTEEFRIAIKLAFRHSQFWPSPQQIIDFVRPKGSLDSEALSMFEAVRQLGEYHESGPFWRKEKVAELGEAALHAFVLVGAVAGFRGITEQNLTFVRRDFVSAYKAKARQSELEKEIERARESLAPHARHPALKSGPQPIGKIVGAVVGTEIA